MVEVLLKKDFEYIVISLELKHFRVSQVFAVEDIQDTQTLTNLDDFVKFDAQRSGYLDLFHQLNEVFGISLLSNLEFCTETFNQQSNKGLVVLLELLSLCGYFFNDGLKLDTRVVLRFDELTDGFVEFFKISIEINIKG